MPKAAERIKLQTCTNGQSTGPSRYRYVILCVALAACALLFWFNEPHASRGPLTLRPSPLTATNSTVCPPVSDTDWLQRVPAACCITDTPRFLEAARHHTVDKVDRRFSPSEGHDYDPLYQQFLAPLRCTAGVKLLEIGLGCGMPYGEGHSLTLWMEYVPFADLIIEVDANEACTRALEQRWKAEPPPWVHTTRASWASALDRVRLEVADQASEASLRALGERYGPFDVTIDDGGHLWRQQIQSIATLWPFLKKGGVHIVEDLQTSSDGPYPVGGREYWPITTVQYINKLQEALHVRKQGDGLDPTVYVGFQTVLRTLQSVACFAEACALVKGGEREAMQDPIEPLEG